MRKDWGKRFNNKTNRLFHTFASRYQSKRKLTHDSRNYLLSSLKYDSELIWIFFKLVDALSEDYLEMSFAGKWIIENRDSLVEESSILGTNINKKLLKILPQHPEKTQPRIYELFRYFYRQRKKLSEKKLIEYVQHFQQKTPLILDEVFSMPLFLKFHVVNSLVDHFWYVLEDTRARNETSFLYHSDRVPPVWRDIEKKGTEYAIYFITHLKKYPHKPSLVTVLREGEAFLEREKAYAAKCLSIIQGEEIGRYVRDLQAIKEMDWDNIFSEISVVDAILSQDPAGTYPRLDITTRNSYLDEFKKISRLLALSEQTLAENIVQLAQNGATPFEKHIGYYIVDKGREVLSPKLKHFRSVGKKTTFTSHIYLTIILAIVVSLYLFIVSTNDFDSMSLILMSVLMILPIYGFVKRVVNTMLTDWVAPRRLSRIDIRQHLDDAHATMFVIPSLLIHKSDIRRLVDSLEITYLANRGDNIFFSLLLDYRDSQSKEEKHDRELFELLSKAVEHLNKRYGFKNKFSFYLRERLWSERQQRWMGWERKRGKLLEFTNILRGNKTLSPYYLSLVDVPNVKYLITVDEDAVIPKDFISDLVGTIAHPLNSAHYDESGKLVRGYVILQPRMNFTFRAKHQTWLSRSLCDASGYDFYSRLLNELYFDLFSEGHYTGKGIIDIDGFIRELNGRFPDDIILSHDLIEGALCGTGYVSDVVIYEGFPSTVKSYLMRDHRWIRGNWQIIDWIFNNVRDQQGQRKKNTLTAFQKFKVFDNMLVSLLNPVIFLLLVLVWLDFRDKSYIAYAILITEFFLLEFVLGLYYILLRHVRNINLYYIFIDTTFLIKNLMKKNLFFFLYLPYDSFLKLDAIGKALFRKYISRRNTLQWSTFTASEGAKNNAFKAYAKIFAIPWLLLAAILVLSIILKIQNTVLIALLSIWLLVPLWTYLYDKSIAYE